MTLARHTHACTHTHSSCHNGSIVFTGNTQMVSVPIIKKQQHGIGQLLLSYDSSHALSTALTRMNIKLAVASTTALVVNILHFFFLNSYPWSSSTLYQAPLCRNFPYSRSVCFGKCAAPTGYNWSIYLFFNFCISFMVCCFASTIIQSKNWTTDSFRTCMFACICAYVLILIGGCLYWYNIL